MHVALQTLHKFAHAQRTCKLSAGAGDRLGLKCEHSGEGLPVAVLPYCGRPLLESLIRDVQAREYLYYKLHGVQQMTPIAIMTSDAKDNHRRVTEFIDQCGWFGRGKDSFRFSPVPCRRHQQQHINHCFTHTWAQIKLDAMLDCDLNLLNVTNIRPSTLSKEAGMQCLRFMYFCVVYAERDVTAAVPLLYKQNASETSH